MVYPVANDVPGKAVRKEAGSAQANQAEPLELDLKALLAIYTDEESLRLIAEAFLDDAGKELILLDKAMAEGDRTKILACCHSLSGSSAIFTAKILTTAVKKLEACVRNGKMHEAVSAWHRVLAAHDSLRGYMASRLGIVHNPVQQPK